LVDLPPIVYATGGVCTTCPGLLTDSRMARSQTHDLVIIGSNMLTTGLSSHIGMAVKITD